ncbi:MAG: radical SAM protein, partial [Verrucomicrobia bacterium]|nr:radical SAM protein [Verrucomicrobiota bacterium]
MAAVRDHARKFSDYTYVYPVISRRSEGLSLGVNLNPDKVCNFDCVYCEVDRKTPGKPAGVVVRQLEMELRDLIRRVLDGGLSEDARFRGLPERLIRDIKDIAFSGDGEPTMIGNFAECAEAVARIKTEFGLTETQLVLITDAAGLDKADVRKGLEVLDAHQGQIWAKLDAGTESYFKAVNRTRVQFNRILSNLLLTARVRPIIIQSLFLKLHGVSISPDELKAYGDRLNEIVQAGGRIAEVHAYTIARPTP